MTGVEQAGGTDAPARPRRVLLVFQRDHDVADLAARIRAAAGSSGPEGLAVEAFRSTGRYRPDPERPQEFVPVSAAVQVDYGPAQEPALLRLLRSVELSIPSGEATISVGSVVTCLEPSGPNLLLLGAQRREDLTPEQFGQHWSHVHAPHAVGELRAAPIPIGYELFLVDHGLSSTAATDQWQPSEVDGWMHITTRGSSDFEKIAQNPEHRAWVLEDESNFVNFAAPILGQQMLAVPHSAIAQSTIR